MKHFFDHRILRILRHRPTGYEDVNPFLWPGEFVSRALHVDDADSRMLLRMFVNLTVYSKIAILCFLPFVLH